MELTFVTDLGNTFVVEIDANMELGNVMALLEAESSIPVSEQSISYEGRELSDPTATMRGLGVGENAMLMLRRRLGQLAGRPIEQDAEMMRLQILGDPRLVAQLQETQPELAAAAQSDPARFAELLRRTHEHSVQQREIERLNADPYDVEAQRRIEEAIRQQAVLENMEHAIEYSPEAFGRVTMLYINVEVNSHQIKAFVDSGAQSTIMSPGAAEACGLMRLLDTRFSGIARGVGTAKILGRVHSAQLKLADLHLPCSFTIMEGRDVDLLLGLDMLKAHQACIDLQKGVLRIQGREVRFLSEHELPENARDPRDPADLAELSASTAGPSTTVPAASQPRLPSFPGGGQTIGTPPTAPAAPAPPAQRPLQAQTAGNRHSEHHIQVLMDLGVTREIAIRTLDAANGNVDVAASLLF